MRPGQRCRQGGAGSDWTWTGGDRSAGVKRDVEAAGEQSGHDRETPGGARNLGRISTAGRRLLSGNVPRALDQLLDSVPWRGDELVLDVGTGSGLLLIAVARRLTTGRAIGIDVWSAEESSGNRPEVTLANARSEGVADRIDLWEGDAQKLPFGDEEFDVVLSSLVLHNIGETAGREQAVREMARVLKPGGRVLIQDSLHTEQYERALKECGATDVTRSKLSFLLLPPVRVVSGTKAGA